MISAFVSTPYELAKEQYVASEDNLYTMEDDDDLASIMQAYELDFQELQSKNPYIDFSKVKGGDSFVIRGDRPALTVIAKRDVTREAEASFGIKYIEDDTLFTGETILKSAGINGTKELTEEEIIVNGILNNTKVLSERMIKKPVKAVLIKGTRPLPSTIAIGKFTWPVYGRIASRFHAYNSHQKGEHTGIDIACEKGTIIRAVDGGKVTEAGWKENYGYYITVDHENGYTSLYAGNSKLKVSSGTRVYQGQIIAESGSLYTSGNEYLHFELFYDENNVNPLKILLGN
ncbi:MAG: peptidoglycan DD-metalloendopeptidase family protein [Enterococcus sp.]|nr:peptidoglycan DD-metalloendopeptidase family protein [Enterococcus sp.]